MKAGKLRHKITIEKMAETATNGVIKKTWTERASVWASSKVISGTEVIQDHSLSDRQQMSWLIRYGSGVLVSDRVVFDDAGTSRYYRIIDIRAGDQRHIWQSLRCIEVPLEDFAK